jgi:TonB family protein
MFCVALAIGQAPARPDFSGAWTLDPSKTVVTGAPARVGGPGSTGVGAVTEPRRTKNVPPVYPAEAQRAGITGVVILEALIDRQGKVRDVQVLRSVPQLDRPAMDAVSQWEYTPTLVAGVPVEVIMTVTVTFALDRAPAQAGRPSVPVAPQPTAPARPGMGRGFVSNEIEIKQAANELTLIRKFASAQEEIRYRFDGKSSSNRLPGTGGAVDSTYVYLSRWEGEKLVSTISWTGPQGKRERTETIWLEGDTLKMETARPSTDASAPPFVTTNVFTRKR